MDKKDILQANKEASPDDEWEIHQYYRAIRVGMVGMFGLTAAIVIYNIFKGLDSDSILAILWAGVGFQMLSKYKQSKDARLLISTIVTFFCAIVYLTRYIIETW